MEELIRETWNFNKWRLSFCDRYRLLQNKSLIVAYRAILSRTEYRRPSFERWNFDAWPKNDKH